MKAIVKRFLLVALKYQQHKANSGIFLPKRNINLTLLELSGFRVKFVSVTESLCPGQTVFVCHIKFVSVTVSLCLS